MTAFLTDVGGRAFQEAADGSVWEFYGGVWARGHAEAISIYVRREPLA